jgi:heterodisulfide reductase subunit B
MDYLYFPGCTLYTKAKNFDQTARNCSLLLGFELKELKNWTCCGGREHPDHPLCCLLQCDQEDEPID